MDKIFRTARPAGEFNLWINRDEKGHLHVTIDTGANGHTVVLTGFEITGFIADIAALQTPAEQPDAPKDGIPPHEPSSCGTAYLASERALRIIERSTKLGAAMGAEAVEQIAQLAHEAGAACNREALRRQFFEDIPF